MDILVEKILQIAKENEVTEIVVGNPLNMNGTKGEKSLKCEKLAGKLNAVLFDERLSTVRAKQIGLENGRNHKSRRENIDAVAAAVILEGYLGSNKL
jgi:putative Holliday junction resolvase